MSAQQVRHNAAAAAPTFGAELRRLRLAAGLSGKALAAAAGITPKHMSQLEHGHATNPSLRTVAALATVLDDAQHLRELAFRARGECCPRCGFGSEEE